MLYSVFQNATDKTMVLSSQFQNGSIGISKKTTIKSTPVSIKGSKSVSLVLVPNNNTVIAFDEYLNLYTYKKFEKEVQGLEEQLTTNGLILSGFKGNYSGSIFRLRLIPSFEISWAFRHNYVENQPIKTTVIDDLIYFMQTNDHEVHIGALDLDDGSQIFRSCSKGKNIALEVANVQQHKIVQFGNDVIFITRGDLTHEAFILVIDYNTNRIKQHSILNSGSNFMGRGRTVVQAWGSFLYFNMIDAT